MNVPNRHDDGGPNLGRLGNALALPAPHAEAVAGVRSADGPLPVYAVVGTYQSGRCACEFAGRSHSFARCYELDFPAVFVSVAVAVPCRPDADDGPPFRRTHALGRPARASHFDGRLGLN